MFGSSGGVSSYPGRYNCSTVYDGWVSQCCPGGDGGASVAFDASWVVNTFTEYAQPLQKIVPVFVNQWSVVHGVPASAGRFQFMSDVAHALKAADIGWAWWVWRGGGDAWSHGSSEMAYYYANGTVEFDEQAIAAVLPYV